MANRIKILFQDYNAIEASGVIPLQEDWSLARKEKISYLTHKDGIEAADEAFHIFNAPPELLAVEQKMILDAYNGPSLSVGDIVEVYPEKGEGTPKAYLCASIGWQEAIIEQPEITPESQKTNIMDASNPAPPPKRKTNFESKSCYKPIVEPTVKFNGITCSIKVDLYSNGKSICLKLVDKQDGSPMTTATVNVPEINSALPHTHVLIKNYSESKAQSPNNYSLIDCLEHAGVGVVKNAYEISAHGAEVFEMEITDPWIISQATKQQKMAQIKGASKISNTKQNIKDTNLYQEM